MKNVLNNAPKGVLNSYAEVEDIFSRFEIQLNRCWLGKFVKQEELIVADPNIKLLKSIEKFVLDIEFQNTPDLSQYRHYVEKKNTVKINELQRYFNQLQFDRNRQPPYQLISEKARIFFDACKQIEEKIKSQNTLIKSSPLLGTRQGSFEFSVDLQNKSEQLQELIEIIKTKIESFAFQKKFRDCRVFAPIKPSEAVEYVDACFKACPQLFVLCMDLGYPSQGKQPYSIKPSKECEGINTHWSDLTARLDNDKGLIGHFQKLEYTAHRGHSLHCTFIFAHQKQSTENDLAIRIGNHWMEITENVGAYHNCNPEIRHEFSDHAVGLIKSTQKSSRDAMERWVIRYSVLSSKYLSARPNQSQVFQIKKQPLSVFTTNQFTTKKEITPKIISAFILSQMEIEQALKISTVNLSTDLGSQIKQMPTIYKELATSFFREDTLPTDFVLDSNFSIESLVQIEAFVAHVRSKNTPAFDTFNPQLDNNPTDKDALKWRNRLGKQLIALNSQWNIKYINHVLLPNIKYLSPSVKIYCAVLCSQDEWRVAENIRPDESVHSGMHFCNAFIRQIRKYLDCDYLIFIEQLKSIQALHYSESVSPKLRSQFGELLTTHPIDQNTLDGNQLIGNNNNNGYASKTSRKQSIQAFMVEQSKNVQAIYDDAETYTNVLFKKDVTLISLKFYINSKSHDIPHQIFSPLLTLFLRLGKNMKPLAWSYGYVGRWEHATDLQRVAHIIFFINKDLIKDIEQVTQKIKTFWMEIVNSHRDDVVREYLAKANSMQPNETEFSNLQGSADCYQISSYLENFCDHHCTINHDNKKLQNIFKRKVLLHLAKSTLYFQPNQPDTPKALIKGQLDTAKTNIKKQWLKLEETAKFRTKDTNHENTPLPAGKDFTQTSNGTLELQEDNRVSSNDQQIEILTEASSQDDDTGTQDAPVTPPAPATHFSTPISVNLENDLLNKSARSRKLINSPKWPITVRLPQNSTSTNAGQKPGNAPTLQANPEKIEDPVINDQLNSAHSHATDFALNEKIEELSDQIDAPESKTVKNRFAMLKKGQEWRRNKNKH